MYDALFSIHKIKLFSNALKCGAIVLYFLLIIQNVYILVSVFCKSSNFYLYMFLMTRIIVIKRINLYHLTCFKLDK